MTECAICAREVNFADVAEVLENVQTTELLAQFAKEQENACMFLRQNPSAKAFCPPPRSDGGFFRGLDFG
jgi:hypothetical protein